MHFFFWQSILSPHQSPYIRALSEIDGCAVTVIAEQALSPDRKRLGWAVPDYGRAEVATCPNQSVIRSLVYETDPYGVHLIEGWRGCQLSAAIYSAVSTRRGRLGVISEASKDLGWKGPVRRGLYKWYCRAYGEKTDFVLTMGQKGVDWFCGCGYPSKKVFPFAYVPEAAHSVQEDFNRSTDNEIAILFLGRCVPGKGCDILLRALQACCDYSWTLTMIGDGPMKPKWTALASQLHITDRVRFLPSMPRPSALAMLHSADLLVLPSTGQEGWGAVVSEALTVGVPVICTDRCGAADLLREDWRGEVVQAGSVESLLSALRKWLLRGKRSNCLTQRLRMWSQRISGPSVANYFLSVVNHVYLASERPEPPWYSSELW